MGLLSNIFEDENENIPAMMPNGVIDQIQSGVLPTIGTSQLMLTKNEKCHYVERAIRVIEKRTKHYEGGSQGVSIRIAKGVTYRTGKYKGKPVEDVFYIKTKGLLYVTDKRIVFVSEDQGFEKKLKSLTACFPYTNAIKFQFGNTTITLMVPDGSIVNQVI